LRYVYEPQERVLKPEVQDVEIYNHAG